MRTAVWCEKYCCCCCRCFRAEVKYLDSIIKQRKLLHLYTNKSDGRQCMVPCSSTVTTATARSDETKHSRKYAHFPTSRLRIWGIVRHYRHFYDWERIFGIWLGERKSVVSGVSDSLKKNFLPHREIENSTESLQPSIARRGRGVLRRSSLMH